MPLSIKTVADMAQVIAQNLWRFDRSAYDVVIGIPRSGILPASIIATYLQLPLADPVGFSHGIIHGRSGNAVKPGRRILLVDDTVNKGGAMSRAIAALPKGLTITRACVWGPYQVENPAALVDIALADCHGPRAFAWNLMKHKRLPRWAFDMDGVLCRDPAKHENDDGDAYRQFCLGAEPLFLPQRPIGHIITSRLEKWREPTEAWLRRHGIEYASLTMMDLPDKRARMSAMKVDGGRGGWKARQIAKVVAEQPIEMMIESCPRQSAIIARTAGIPVFCTQTQEVFDAAGS